MRAHTQTTAINAIGRIKPYHPMSDGDTIMMMFSLIIPSAMCAMLTAGVVHAQQYESMHFSAPPERNVDSALYTVEAPVVESDNGNTDNGGSATGGVDLSGHSRDATREQPGLGTGAAAAIAVGGAVLMVAAVTVALMLLIRHRRVQLDAQLISAASSSSIDPATSSSEETAPPPPPPTKTLPATDDGEVMSPPPPWYNAAFDDNDTDNAVIVDRAFMMNTDSDMENSVDSNATGITEPDAILSPANNNQHNVENV